jgi:anti-sigma B factor antagonist
MVGEMAIEISRTERDGKLVVTVQGEVDLYSSPELRTAVLKHTAKWRGDVWVDLRDVPYMDSSGVATLVEGYRAAKERQQAFVLVAPSQAVLKVLQLSRLDTVFTIHYAG